MNLGSAWQTGNLSIEGCSFLHCIPYRMTRGASLTRKSLIAHDLYLRLVAKSGIRRALLKSE